MNQRLQYLLLRGRVAPQGSVLRPLATIEMALCITFLSFQYIFTSAGLHNIPKALRIYYGERNAQCLTRKQTKEMPDTAMQMQLLLLWHRSVLINSLALLTFYALNHD